MLLAAIHHSAAIGARHRAFGNTRRTKAADARQIDMHQARNAAHAENSPAHAQSPGIALVPIP